MIWNIIKDAYISFFKSNIKTPEIAVGHLAHAGGMLMGSALAIFILLLNKLKKVNMKNFIKNIKEKFSEIVKETNLRNYFPLEVYPLAKLIKAIRFLLKHKRKNMRKSYTKVKLYKGEEVIHTETIHWLNKLTPVLFVVLFVFLLIVDPTFRILTGSTTGIVLIVF